MWCHLFSSLTLSLSLSLSLSFPHSSFALATAGKCALLLLCEYYWLMNAPLVRVLGFGPWREPTQFWKSQEKRTSHSSQRFAVQPEREREREREKEKEKNHFYLHLLSYTWRFFSLFVSVQHRNDEQHNWSIGLTTDLWVKSYLHPHSHEMKWIDLDVNFLHATKYHSQR